MRVFVPVTARRGNSGVQREMRPALAEVPGGRAQGAGRGAAHGAQHVVLALLQAHVWH